jgi:hypothetical protein
MIIVMMPFRAVFTQSITDSIIRSGDGVDNAFFYKGLQGAVDGNPVKLFTGFLFDIAMGQRILALQERAIVFCGGCLLR